MEGGGREEGEAKCVRPNRSDVSGETRDEQEKGKQESKGWMRIVSKEGETLQDRQGGRLGEETGRGVGLA